MLYAATTTSSSPVWHFWLAVPLAAGAIAVVVGVAALYVARVSKTRYPKGDG